MATFSTWMKSQESRDDRVGFGCRTWSVLTPGRISSVLGIQRHLDRLIDEARPGESDEADENRRKLILVQECITEAAREYGAVQAADLAEATGPVPASVLPFPPQPGAAVHTASDQPERAAPEPHGRPYWQARFDRLEQKLDQVLATLAGAGAVIPEPVPVSSADQQVFTWKKPDGSIDWEGLHAVADEGAAG